MVYMPRPDGLNDVVLDDGTRVPSALSAGQLEAMGHAPIPMPGPNPFGGLPSDAVAGPGGGDDGDIRALYGQSAAPSVPRLPADGAPLPGKFQTGNQQPSPAEFRALLNAQQRPPEPTVYSQPTPAEFRTMIHAERPKAASHVSQRQDIKFGTIERDPHNAQPVPGPNDFTEDYPDNPPSPKAIRRGGRNLIPLGGGAPASPSSPYGQPQARVTKLKGGDVRASFVRQPGEEVGDDVKSDLLNNDPEQMDIDTVQNAEERDKLRLDVEQQLQNQQQQVDQAAARRAQIDNMLNQKQQLIDQRDRDTEKLTPQTAREVWDDKSALARVFAGLAIVIGGGLQGMQGRATNPGLDMINQSIRDTVADQRARYEDSIKRGKELRNDYSQALALYGTPEAAALDIEMRHNALAEKLIQNQAQSITDRDKQTAAFQAADQLRQQRAELKMKLSELEKGKVLQENWVNVPDRYIASGGPPKIPKDARERLVRLPDGNYGFVRAPDARDKVQGKLTAGSDILTGLQKLKRLADTANLRTDFRARTQFNAIAADTLPLVNVAAGQGAVSEGDRKNVEQLLGSPDAIIQDNGAALEQAIRAQQSRLNSTIRDNVHADPDALYPYSAGRPQVESDE